TPDARVRGLVAACARLVNIDGYAVLDDDGQIVILDRSLARIQFGPSHPSAAAPPGTDSRPGE
ncbi:MAG TPA: hypothetical protein VFV02_00400, partial [Acidimicrobiales bacterium]|nr:hypothetical protein [Acidimicrobiales bacterium]